MNKINIRISPATLITEPLSWYVDCEVVCQIAATKYANENGLECVGNVILDASEEDLTVLTLLLADDPVDVKEYTR